MTQCLFWFLFLQPHYIKTDFNKWRDEDDSDVEDNLANEANFEDVSKIYWASHVPEISWLKSSICIQFSSISCQLFLY
jgi:hypothetical protein